MLLLVFFARVLYRSFIPGPLSEVHDISLRLYQVGLTLFK